MIELLQGRLASYRSVDALAEEQALKEMLQELILYALWRNAFFDRAAFQGGTSLRILHGLPRFCIEAEDMDFDPDRVSRPITSTWEMRLSNLAPGQVSRLNPMHNGSSMPWLRKSNPSTGGGRHRMLSRSSTRWIGTGLNCGGASCSWIGSPNWCRDRSGQNAFALQA